MIMASSALSDRRARHFGQGVPFTLTETPFERGSVMRDWMDGPSSGSKWSRPARLTMTKVADTEVISLTKRERRGCQGLMKCHFDKESCSGIVERKAT